MILQTRMIRNTILPWAQSLDYPRMSKEYEKTTHPPAAPEMPPAVLDSAALLQGRSEVVIRHAGREYRLRRTRLDKLILTA